MAKQRNPDQGAPAAVGPTGKVKSEDDAGNEWRSQAGEYLTTAAGVRVPETDRSLKAGKRGPTLIEDFHFREKVSHFDHERIPERVVHARGAGAHGIFTSYGKAASVTKASFLAEEGKQTRVFVRFSTVLGSRGSADTVRDTRGFATKFYTDEGTFDLVGNNIPVFFIQDAIKFPDIIHAAKPHPDREIPQAQSAHDTFWDFVSLHTEATHHTMWNMSDRGIPRSFRTMEGFGVHTFRLVNAADESALVKFHWKPVAGVHSLTWEEAQIAAGCDPDFHRRDLYDAIENGAFPEWELGLQVFPDTEDETFEGIDLLDSTKFVPEELSPVQLVGRLTLNRNPTNFFAEVEQVAYNTSHVVPGIDFTNDPLLQGRNFSYLDTQLTRLHGPNWTQLPINRPHAPVNDMLRDSFHQHAVHEGVAPYLPNTLDGGLPMEADAEHGGFVTVPRPVKGTKTREKHVTFDDHYSQVTLFYNSMTPVEKAHIAEAYTFELTKCYETFIRERVLEVLAKVDAELCATVAMGLGLPAPAGDPATDAGASPALSQIPTKPGPVDSRVVGVIAGDGADIAGVGKLRAAVEGQNAVLRVVAPHGGFVANKRNQEPVERTFLATRSVEYDAIVVADGAGSLTDPRIMVLLQEMFRHCKAIGAWGDGVNLLVAAGIPTDAPGVIVSDAATAAMRKQLIIAMGMHRAWDRFPVLPGPIGSA